MRGPPEPWHSGPVNDLDTLITEWLTLPDVAEQLDVEVSRVRRLIEEGLPPSWEDRVRPEDTRPGSMADAPDRGDGANDARLLENVPPHAQARA